MNRFVRVSLCSVLIACSSSTPQQATTVRDTNRDVASSAIRQYAFEAFPSWVANNPDRECPARLDELNAYANQTDSRDPWGTPYLMQCSKILVVASAGEDRRFGTADDIWSNR